MEQMSEKDVRLWCTLCHASALLGWVFSGGLASLIAPLIIWLVQRDKHPAIDEHGKESVNFQISVLIYLLCCIPLLCVFYLGAVLAVIIGITELILVIVASIKANSGEMYRYPLTIRLIK